jgi:hypothetical protein
MGSSVDTDTREGDNLEVSYVSADRIVEEWMDYEGRAIDSGDEDKNYIEPRAELGFLSRIWREEGPILTDSYFRRPDVTHGYKGSLLRKGALIDLSQLDPRKEKMPDIHEHESQLRARGYLKEDSLAPTESAKSLLEGSDEEIYMINPRLRTIFEDGIIRTKEWDY